MTQTVTSTLEDDLTEISLGRVFARRGGTARHETPAMLVHGLVVSSSYMIPLAQQLALYCPVFALDLPGYGRSCNPAETLTIPQQADALEEWLAAKGFTRVTGHRCVCANSNDAPDAIVAAMISANTAT